LGVSDFKWLLIDSCGAMATMAVGRGEAVVATEAVTGRAFSAEWPGVLRRLLAEAEWGVAELQVVGVVYGPGSFTGVRVGLAAAKGLCESVGARLIAMSRLEVLVTNRVQGSGPRAQSAADGVGVLAVLDAGRDEFYVRDGRVERLLTLEEMVAAAQEREVVTVDARVAELGRVEVVEMSAVFALPMLLARWRGGEFDDVATIDANYVRGEHDIYARKTAESGSAK
jgi:tRNA threonylcarbamoyladenosine biosynthesis protein TsaB